MPHKISIEPTEEPVILSEMRAVIGVVDSDFTARDQVIIDRIVAARKWLESITKSAFITQTWISYNTCFSDYFDLIGPLQSVDSISYTDSSGIEQIIPSSDYDVDTVANIVLPVYNKTWPFSQDRHNSIKIQYVSGYSNASDVPEEIKTAIQFLVSHWENFQSDIEGSIITTVPYAVKQIIRQHFDLRYLD